MQEFQFKPKNHIHYKTRKGLLKGSYLIKSIDIQITSITTPFLIQQTFYSEHDLSYIIRKDL